ncbi:hypothetical protein RJT34_17073 [Clitoria ternatea]|uniref:Uncharacterized protein n=1 Tax=Clitoria ternatea TaxID=43366 RepID=A0AAN9J8M1_CLITE
MGTQGRHQKDGDGAWRWNGGDMVSWVGGDVGEGRAFCMLGDLEKKNEKDEGGRRVRSFGKEEENEGVLG